MRGQLLPLMVQEIYCRKRPFIEYFLNKLSKFYEIVVFSSSDKEYTKAVLKRIDPNSVHIDHVLFKNNCKKIKGKYLVKDLALLGRDLANVVIIDNSPESYLLQSANALPISSWYEDKYDEELLNFVPIFQRIWQQPKDVDVRSILK